MLYLMCFLFIWMCCIGFGVTTCLVALWQTETTAWKPNHVWGYYFAWLLCDKLKQMHGNLTMFGFTTLLAYYLTNWNKCMQTQPCLGLLLYFVSFWQTETHLYENLTMFGVTTLLCYFLTNWNTSIWTPNHVWGYFLANSTCAASGMLLHEKRKY